MKRYQYFITLVHSEWKGEYLLLNLKDFVVSVVLGVGNGIFWLI